MLNIPMASCLRACPTVAVVFRIAIHNHASQLHQLRHVVTTDQSRVVSILSGPDRISDTEQLPISCTSVFGYGHPDPGRAYRPMTFGLPFATHRQAYRRCSIEQPLSELPSMGTTGRNNSVQTNRYNPSTARATCSSSLSDTVSSCPSPSSVNSAGHYMYHLLLPLSNTTTFLRTMHVSPSLCCTLSTLTEHCTLLFPSHPSTLPNAHCSSATTHHLSKSSNPMRSRALYYKKSILLQQHHGHNHRNHTDRHQSRPLARSARRAVLSALLGLLQFAAL